MISTAARRPRACAARKPAATLMVGILAIAALLLGACGGVAQLRGTDLGKQPAYDFSLTDQRGETVSLSQFRGKAVALTFVYTHCTDVCPLIAEHLRAAYQQLPTSIQGRVAMVAITVDPARDNQAAMEDFSRKHGLADNAQWFALTGTKSQLQPIWSAYDIDPGAMIDEDMATPTAGGTPEPTPTSYKLSHTDAIFLIDSEGNERVLMHSDSSPKDIADNLKALAQ